MLKIELLKPHTHAGRDYPPGAVLGLNPADAEWLIALGTAKAMDAKTESKPKQRPDQTPTPVEN